LLLLLILGALLTSLFARQLLLSLTQNKLQRFCLHLFCNYFSFVVAPVIARKALHAGAMPSGRWMTEDKTDSADATCY